MVALARHVARRLAHYDPCELDLPEHVERDNLDLRENQRRHAGGDYAALGFFAAVFLVGLVLAAVMWGGVGE